MCGTMGCMELLVVQDVSYSLSRVYNTTFLLRYKFCLDTSVPVTQSLVVDSMPCISQCPTTNQQHDVLCRSDIQTRHSCMYYRLNLAAS